MKRFYLLLFIFLLVACSADQPAQDFTQKPSNTLEKHLSNEPTSEGECPPNTIIEWLDVVMIEDIQYEYYHPYPSNDNSTIAMEKGRELGEVTYKMAEQACTDYQIKNGDAAYLEIGTKIYEIKGYPTNFIVSADERAYIVTENKQAKTVGELYPMQAFVKNIYIQSDEDGKRLHTFSEENRDRFLSLISELPLENIDSLYEDGKFEGNRVFLEIELDNGITFSQLYWSDTNTFHLGAIGNEEIKQIIDSEIINMNES